MEVAFEGNESLDSDQLSGAVTFRGSGAFDDTEIASSARAIRSAYQSIAHYYAKVSHRVEQPAPGRIRVVFVVDEGPRVFVREVRVEGGGKRSFECAGRPVSLSRKTEIEHEGEEAIAVGAQTADPWTTARSGSTPTREELYNLAADPEERQDLSRSHPDQLTRMRSALAAARTPSSLPVAPTRELSSDEIEALRKLGYVE